MLAEAIVKKNVKEAINYMVFFGWIIYSPPPPRARPGRYLFLTRGRRFNTDCCTSLPLSVPRVISGCNSCTPLCRVVFFTVVQGEIGNYLWIITRKEWFKGVRLSRTSGRRDSHLFLFFPPKPREEGKKNMAATPVTPKTEEDGPPPPTNKHPLIPPEGQGARSVQRIKTNIATPIKRRQSKHASVVHPAAWLVSWIWIMGVPGVTIWTLFHGLWGTTSQHYP